MRFVADYTRPLGDLADRAGLRGRALADLVRLGIRVPPGFVVSDVVCRRFLETGDIPSDAWEEIEAALVTMSHAFASMGVTRPQLFAVRSSPGVAMPGVLNSALYLGATTEVLSMLATAQGPGFAATVRLGILETLGLMRGLSPARYQSLLADVAGPEAQATLTTSQLEALAAAYRDLIVEESQRSIPDDVPGQLREAIESVFASWDRIEARRHRRRHGIADEDGMAVVIHPMIFGELPGDSGAGTVFSRDPVEGTPNVTGIYAPGESRPRVAIDDPRLSEVSATGPGASLVEVVRCLETEWGELVRLDYVCEGGEVWVIDGRVAGRSTQAAVRVAVEFVDEGLHSIEDALLSIDPERLGGILHPRFVTPPSAPPMARGLASSPGVATGPVVLTAADAIDSADAGLPAILVLREVLPRDLDGVARAAGLVTGHGGGTSHAAVAARAAGTPSVTGVGEPTADPSTVRIGDRVIGAGEWITIDGATGAVYQGKLPVAQPVAVGYLERLLEWADQFRSLGVWANADTALSAAAAKAAGADGIGLARTEYMFQGERLDVVRRILLSDSARDRADALVELENLQIGDFEGLLGVMDGTPVVVRLLDPPVHEFLPSRVDIELEMARRRLAGESVADLVSLEAAVEQWSEVNPMLGLPRCTSGRRHPRDLPGAGARGPRGGAETARRRRRPAAPTDDSAGGLDRGASAGA